MQVITDANELLRKLGAYAFNPSIDPELAERLQTAPGNAVDKIFLAMELLNTFRDRVGEAGLEMLGQLAAFSRAQQWEVPGQVGRIDGFLKGALRDLGEPGEHPLPEEDPEPILVYREDGKDWREDIAPDLAALKQRRKALVMQQLAQCLTGGFTPTEGPIAGHTLQMRDEEDHRNWLTSQATYSSLVMQGAGAMPGANFRTASNQTVTCTFAEGLQTLLDMAAWGAAAMARSWALKDEIDAIEVVADDIDAAIAALDAIDVTVGWP